jgi:hypothetical protein
MGKRVTAVVLLAVCVLLAGVPAPARGQGRPVRFDGRVQWIAAQAMAVQLDNGASVVVDLVRVPQEQYAVLSPNERVTVIGVIMDGSRRVTGTSILRSDEVQSP